MAVNRRVVFFSSVLIAISLATPSYTSAADQYGYDALGRISSVRYEDGLCVIYSYDRNGNIIRQIANAAPLETSMLWGSDNWTNFAWSSAFHWTALGEGGTWGCLLWTGP